MIVRRIPIMSILAANRPAVHTDPSGHYDEEGNLVIDVGNDLFESTLLPLARLALTSTLPPDAFDWDALGDILFVRWDHARTVERILVQLFPGTTVTAAANPVYKGVRGGAR